jgi:AraC-like DNA-binding protein
MDRMSAPPQHLLFETDLLRVTDCRCAGHDGLAEVAPDHEIVLPRTGSYVRRDASGTAVADANHVLFFQRGQAYDVHHPVAGGDRSTDFALKGDTALELAGHFDPHVQDHPERPFPLGGFTLGRPSLGLALHRLTLAARAVPQDPLELEESALLLLGSLLRQAFGAAEEAAPPRGSVSATDHREAAGRVRLLLRQGLTRRVGLGELARQAGYSAYHLCRLFKQQTGLSIHRYLQHLRLQESLELLVEFPRRSVAEIALGLGFSSHSHFSSAFTGHFALSPRAFRRRANGHALQELRKILED